jgi:prepilin-type N-terminal cleavage/methylation domain-containing protein
MKPRHTASRAFTLVEMLVVISIIGILLGMILPALSGVQRQSHKTTEINNLKQVNLAWLMYANNNNDAALPGYLEQEVQEPPVNDFVNNNFSRGWGVTYEYPNRSDIPNDANNVAGPWTWRLLPYFDYSHAIVREYSGDDAEVMLDVHANLAEAQQIAQQPAFGYNGYYVGGYWRMLDFNNVPTPRPDYWNHCNAAPPGEALQLVQSLSQMQRSSQLVIFCSSSKLAAGDYFRFADDIPGWHLVEPPYREDDQIWSNIPPENAFDTLHVYTSEGAVPIPRYTKTAAVLFGDGHIDANSPGALLDQRMWINNATRDLSGGTPAPYMHTQCP